MTTDPSGPSASGRDEPDEAPRVLVTGATGTVGTPLVARLADAPVAVRVAVRSPEDAGDRFETEAEPADGSDSKGLEYAELDLERPETWGAALADVDRLFLLVPPAVGVDPVRAFADAAARVGVGRVVFLSVLGAEKLPFLPHRRAERHLERSGAAWTFLRASWFMQNLTGIHRPEIVERDEIFVPAGDGTLNPVDARDVAAVAAAALAEPGHEHRAYDLTGPAALDFAAVAEAFTDALGRRITYADPSRLAFAWHMYRRGVPAGLTAFMLAEYSVVRLGRSGRTTDTVEALLGRPPHTVREFVADHAEAFEPAPAPGSGGPAGSGVADELVAGRVYRLDLGWVNAYLVDDGAVTLIDAGTPRSLGALRRGIAEAGYEERDVDRVLVTHFDLDHVGALADLRFDGPVYAMEPDAGFLDGSRRPPLTNHKGLLQRLTDGLRTRPSRPIARIADGERVGGFTAYHTPGHSPGHAVYVREDLGVAFLGDLVAEDGGELETSPWPITYDGAEHAASVRALADRDLDFDVAATGHGDPIREGGDAALTDLARRLA